MMTTDMDSGTEELVPAFKLRDYRPYRLVLSPKGPHHFGGKAMHKGVVPPGTKTPLQLLLTLDLANSDCPVQSENGVRYLPLYYPLKYGQGGPEVQYAVLSDSEIQILYLSDPVPDDKGSQYVQVSYLPESKAHLMPLTYEEARILGFREADAYFRANDEDAAILRRLYRGKFISMGSGPVHIGGFQVSVRNAREVICKNKGCELFGRRTYFEPVAAIPPIPVNGSAEFWYEFEGGNMQFCFGFCRCCGTVIAFNRAG